VPGFPADNPGMLITAALVAGLLSVVPQSGSADLSVDLHATSSIVFNSARYDVTITNNGPDPLTSATVVVQLSETGYLSGTQNTCTGDSQAKTITCVFGPLAVGASATMSGSAMYPMSGRARLIYATATRTASSPADPNQANDADTVDCYYDGSQGIPPTGRPSLWC
jgi:hypothetical protein